MSLFPIFYGVYGIDSDLNLMVRNFCYVNILLKWRKTYDKGFLVYETWNVYFAYAIKLNRKWVH